MKQNQPEHLKNIFLKAVRENKITSYIFPLLNFDIKYKYHYFFIKTDEKNLKEKGYSLLERININGHEGTVLGTINHIGKNSAIICHENTNEMPTLYTLLEKNKYRKISPPKSQYLPDSVSYYIAQAIAKLNSKEIANKINELNQEITSINATSIDYSLVWPDIFPSKSYIIDSESIQKFTRGRLSFLSAVATPHGTGTVVGITTLNHRTNLVVLLDLQVQPIFFNSTQVKLAVLIKGVFPPPSHTTELILKTINYGNRNPQLVESIIKPIPENPPNLPNVEFYQIYKDIILKFYPIQQSIILDEILNWVKTHIDITPSKISEAFECDECFESDEYDESKYYYIEIYTLIYAYRIYSQQNHPYFADLQESGNKDFRHTVFNVLAFSAILANKYHDENEKIKIEIEDFFIPDEEFKPNYKHFINKFVLAFELLNFNASLENTPSVTINILRELGTTNCLFALQTFRNLQDNLSLQKQVKIDEKREKRFVQSIDCFWPASNTQESMDEEQHALEVSDLTKFN